MPIPKDKQEEYGIIAATMQKRGKSLEEAKDIADRAVMGKKHKSQGAKRRMKGSKVRY